MKWYYNLYLDEKAKLKKEQILEKIKADDWQLEIYCITLAANEKNHLEIFHSALLLQKAIRKDSLFLVGIASGYYEAMELVEKITEEVYDNTKGTDIRHYILNSQRVFEEGNV